MSPRWLFAMALALFGAGLGGDLFEAWIDKTVLPPLVHETSVEIRDRDGVLLRVYPVEDGIWRLKTRLEDVDPDYVDLLLAVEDKRFFRHSGVDPVALGRAALQAILYGRVVSGGSTLTMQTARLVENSGTGGWSGKLRQIRVALALERRLDKDRILSLYLTHAPFGGNLEGVRAASLAWFSKPPNRLSPEEAALLVALPQSPTRRRPDRAPDVATQARDRILVAQGYLGPHHPVPEMQTPFPRLAPHLADRAVLRPGNGRLTLDHRLQTRMEALANRAVSGLAPQTGVAILVADHQKGEVLAHVGSANYGEGQNAGFVDMVRAVRSPGSTLKPLVYGLAFDQGLGHPETLVSDTPVMFGTYAPQNFDGFFRGDVTLRTALEQSLNIPPVRLTNAMGPARLVAALERSGARPTYQGRAPGLAVALGGVGLTLEDLVQLYAGIASGGLARPLSWRMGRDEPVRARIMSAEAAWHVGHILAGIQPPAGQPRGQVAFKTGTSYGHRDAWAIGFDGQHVIGVWLGRPDGTPVPGIFGGDVAAPILFEAFDRVSPQRTPLAVPPPATLMVSNAKLPKPLRFFGQTGRRQAQDLTIAFPPDRAALRMQRGDPIVLKVRGGVPPYAVLANGKAVIRAERNRTIRIPSVGRGFSKLTVLDANGSADSVQIRID